MVYRLMITEHADELSDALVCHLLNEFQSEQASSVGELSAKVNFT